MIRKRSWRRLQAVIKILRKNRLILSENRLIGDLLEEYLKAWRGKVRATKQARRYNLRGQDYIRRAIYLRNSLYHAAWQHGTYSGESISRMVDFALRYYLPALLAQYLAVPPKSYYETRNSEYWRRRWYLRKSHRPTAFLNYSQIATEVLEGGWEWIQKIALSRDNTPEVPPWDPRSCFAYLYLKKAT